MERPRRASTSDGSDPPLADLFQVCPEVALLFLARRMACVGCPIAPFHTVADACREYGLAEGRFRAALAAAGGGEPDRAGPGALP
jgi:hybrid cluster-associated redox disulfide protein